MKTKLAIIKSLDECRNLSNRYKEMRDKGMSEEEIANEMGLKSVSALRINLYHSLRVIKISESKAAKILHDNGLDVTTIAVVTKLTPDIVKMLINEE